MLNCSESGDNGIFTICPKEWSKLHYLGVLAKSGDVQAVSHRQTSLFFMSDMIKYVFRKNIVVFVRF